MSLMVDMNDPLVNTEPQYFRNYFLSNFGKDSSAGKNDKRYNSEAIIFRTESEHTIDGKRSDLEMQIMHTQFSDEN